MKKKQLSGNREEKPDVSINYFIIIEKVEIVVSDQDASHRNHNNLLDVIFNLGVRLIGLFVGFF